MKVLITGGSGLLGQYLNIEISKDHDILTLYNHNAGNCTGFNSQKVDLTDYESVEKIFTGFKPDIVVHTAAVSNPEKADKLSFKDVYEINVNVSEQLAGLCKKYNAKLIYTSTELVYAGYRGSMLTEESKLIPISLYAETKLMGEVKIRQTFDNHIILRTALLYGFGTNGSINNFHRMYNNLKEGKPSKLYYDQFRTPLELNDAARMINGLLVKDIKGETFNFGGRERVSRLELGEIFCDIAGFDKNLLIRTSMEEAGAVYKVADVSMNTDKLQKLGIAAKDIRTSIEGALAKLTNIKI